MDQIEEIKGRIDIVELIGQYIQLKRVGINYSACCPFHKEKTPSFMVSPERQVFKCFGCGESGDVISFLQKMEGLSFPDALKILGERAGIEVEFRGSKQGPQEKSEKDTVLKLNLLSAKYFKAMLWSPEGTKALEYLKKRGLTDKVIEKFKIGWAPGANKLESVCFKYKFSAGDLAKAGSPERFRYRIMFPIFDILGNVVGFSGRILETVLPEGVSPHPKYLNTPETAVFHKSKVLYGLHLAKNAIREKSKVIVVEGQMDVVSSHLCGVENVVASSGTALTQDHLKILSRLTQNVVFAFDEDEAGQKAAFSAVQMAFGLSLEPRLTIMQKYKDVGELSEHEPKIWQKIVDDALPPVEWLAKRAKIAKQSWENFSAQDKKELVKKSLMFISRMNDEIEKAHYIAYIAKVVGVPTVSVEKALLKSSDKPKTETENLPEIKVDIEAKILSGLIFFPKMFSKNNLFDNIEFANNAYNQVYKQVKECYNSKSESIEKDLRNLLESLTRDERELFAVYALEWDKIIEDNQKDAIQEFSDFKRNIMQTKLEKVKSSYASAIAEAEVAGDISRLKKLMEELQQNLKN